MAPSLVWLIAFQLWAAQGSQSDSPACLTPPEGFKLRQGDLSIVNYLGTYESLGDGGLPDSWLDLANARAQQARIRSALATDSLDILALPTSTIQAVAGGQDIYSGTEIRAKVFVPVPGEASVVLAPGGLFGAKTRWRLMVDDKVILDSSWSYEARWLVPKGCLDLVLQVVSDTATLGRQTTSPLPQISVLIDSRPIPAAYFGVLAPRASERAAMLTMEYLRKRGQGLATMDGSGPLSDSAARRQLYTYSSDTPALITNMSLGGTIDNPTAWTADNSSLFSLLNDVFTPNVRNVPLDWTLTGNAALFVHNTQLPGAYGLAPHTDSERISMDVQGRLLAIGSPGSELPGKAIIMTSISASNSFDHVEQYIPVIPGGVALAEGALGWDVSVYGSTAAFGWPSFNQDGLPGSVVLAQVRETGVEWFTVYAPFAAEKDGFGKAVAVTDVWLFAAVGDGTNDNVVPHYRYNASQVGFAHTQAASIPLPTNLRVTSVKAERDILVVGAANGDSFENAVYVFNGTGDTYDRIFTLIQTISPPDGYSAGNYVFGSTMDLQQGNLAIFGAADGDAVNSAIYIYTWSDTEFFQLAVDRLRLDTPVLTNVSIYDLHACALDEEKQLYCWGDNGQGQFGIAGAGSDRPVQINTIIGNIASVATGSSFTVVLLDSGVVYTMGANNNYQLGDGTTTSRATPAPVLGLPQIVSVYAGYGAAGAITSSGEVYVWGSNDFGLLGQTSDIGNGPFLYPIPSLETAVKIAIGFQHMCVLTESHILYCSGDNSNGQLGMDEAYTAISTPFPLGLPGGRYITDVACSKFMTCVLASDNTIWCTGQGYLGNGADFQTSYGFNQTLYAAAHTLVSIAASDSDIFMAVTADNQVYAWGNDVTGYMLGTGFGANQDEPSPVVLPMGFKPVAADLGRYSSCLLGDDGTLRCWGSYGGTNGDGRGSDTSLDKPLSTVNFPKFHFKSPVILSGNKLLAVDTDLNLRIFEWQNRDPYVLAASNGTCLEADLVPDMIHATIWDATHQVVRTVSFGFKRYPTRRVALDVPDSQALASLFDSLKQGHGVIVTSERRVKVDHGPFTGQYRVIGGNAGYDARDAAGGINEPTPETYATDAYLLDTTSAFDTGDELKGKHYAIELQGSFFLSDIDIQRALLDGAETMYFAPGPMSMDAPGIASFAGLDYFAARMLVDGQEVYSSYNITQVAVNLTEAAGCHSFTLQILVFYPAGVPDPVVLPTIYTSIQAGFVPNGFPIIVDLYGYPLCDIRPTPTPAAHAVHSYVRVIAQALGDLTAQGSTAETCVPRALSRAIAANPQVAGAGIPHTAIDTVYTAAGGNTVFLSRVPLTFAQADVMDTNELKARSDFTDTDTGIYAQLVAECGALVAASVYADLDFGTGVLFARVAALSTLAPPVANSTTPELLKIGWPEPLLRLLGPEDLGPWFIRGQPSVKGNVLRFLVTHNEPAVPTSPDFENSGAPYAATGPVPFLLHSTAQQLHQPAGITAAVKFKPETSPAGADSREYVCTGNGFSDFTAFVSLQQPRVVFRSEAPNGLQCNLYLVFTDNRTMESTQFKINVRKFYTAPSDIIQVSASHDSLEGGIVQSMNYYDVTSYHSSLTSSDEGSSITHPWTDFGAILDSNTGAYNYSSGVRVLKFAYNGPSTSAAKYTGFYIEMSLVSKPSTLTPCSITLDTSTRPPELNGNITKNCVLRNFETGQVTVDFSDLASAPFTDNATDLYAIIDLVTPGSDLLLDLSEIQGVTDPQYYYYGNWTVSGCLTDDCQDVSQVYLFTYDSDPVPSRLAVGWTLGIRHWLIKYSMPNGATFPLISTPLPLSLRFTAFPAYNDRMEFSSDERLISILDCATADSVQGIDENTVLPAHRLQIAWDPLLHVATLKLMKTQPTFLDASTFEGPVSTQYLVRIFKPIDVFSWNTVVFGSYYDPDTTLVSGITSDLPDLTLDTCFVGRSLTGRQDDSAFSLRGLLLFDLFTANMTDGGHESAFNKLTTFITALDIWRRELPPQHLPESTLTDPTAKVNFTEVLNATLVAGLPDPVAQILASSDVDAWWGAKPPVDDPSDNEAPLGFSVVFNNTVVRSVIGTQAASLRTPPLVLNAASNGTTVSIAFRYEQEFTQEGSPEFTDTMTLLECGSDNWSLQSFYATRFGIYINGTRLLLQTTSQSSEIAIDWQPDPVEWTTLTVAFPSDLSDPIRYLYNDSSVILSVPSMINPNDGRYTCYLGNAITGQPLAFWGDLAVVDGRNPAWLRPFIAGEVGAFALFDTALDNVGLMGLHTAAFELLQSNYFSGVTALSLPEGDKFGLRIEGRSIPENSFASWIHTPSFPSVLFEGPVLYYRFDTTAGNGIVSHPLALNVGSNDGITVMVRFRWNDVAVTDNERIFECGFPDSADPIEHAQWVNNTRDNGFRVQRLDNSSDLGVATILNAAGIYDLGFVPGPYSQGQWYTFGFTANSTMAYMVNNIGGIETFLLDGSTIFNRPSIQCRLGSSFDLSVGTSNVDIASFTVFDRAIPLESFQSLASGVVRS